MKYNHVSQDNISDCAAACLQMIIKYYKGYIDKEEIRQLIKTNSEGTTALNLINGAIEIGFNAKGYEIELNDLKETKYFPVIAHVTNKNVEHFIVIYKYNERNNTFLIADPSDKLKTVDFEYLGQIYNNIAIVLYPIKKIPLNFEYSTLSFLKNLFDNFKKDFISLFFISLLVSIITIISTFNTKYIIDSIVNGKSYLFLITIIFIIISLYKNIISLFKNKINLFTEQKIDLILSNSIYTKLINLPYQYYKNNSTGDLVSRVNDFNIVKQTILKLISVFLIDFIYIILILITLFIINKNIFLYSVILLIINIILILAFQKVFSRDLFLIKLKNAELNSKFIETLNNYESIKSSRLENNFINRLNDKNINLLEKLYNFKNNYIKFSFIKEIINNIALILIIYYASTQVITLNLTIGNLFTLSILIPYLFDFSTNLVSAIIELKEFKISLKRILEIKNYEYKEGLISNNINGNIKIKNLNFSYEDKIIFKNLNIDIKKGDKVMILGPSGVGKTTLFKMIMKYYEIKRDKLFINNEDINDYDNNYIKDKIAYVNQNEILIQDTIYNNIDMYRNTPKETILKVAKICKVNKLVKNNLGYNSLILENGFNYSSGEASRIILARNLVKDFEILLIDEVLNKVDVSLERNILKEIFKQYENKTILIISHRQENMDLYNKVLKFDGRKVIQLEYNI